MIFEKMDLPNFGPAAACRKLDTSTVDRVFFSEPSDREAFVEARDICNGCDEKTKCMSYALTHPELEGIWAGTSKRMRERMRTKMRKAENATQ